MNPETDFTNYTAATISGMISRASKWVDNYLQYSLGVEEITSEKEEAVVSSDGNLIIYTRKRPLQSVSAISLKLGTANIALSMADGNGNARYDIPSRQTHVVYPYQEIAFTGTLSIRNFYQLRGITIYAVISYRAGYETIPDDIKDAVNLVTKDIFIRQANPMDLAGMTQGAISMSFRDRDGGESDMIRDAKAILQDYKKVFS